MIAAGTRIATPGGGRPAESFAPGDVVLALEDGEPVPRQLRWVGHIQIDMARSHAPERVAPVRLLAGAIAPGLPARDLQLSPDHVILLGGGLFQAQALRNGATVVQDFSRARMVYVHLELARHALLGAEALPVGSYLDTGARLQSTVGRRSRGFAPDLSVPPDPAALMVWKSRGCAPLRLGSAAIVPAHQMVLQRARSLGWRLTDEPDLRVLIGDDDVPTARFGPAHWQARLPDGARAVRLTSRSFVANEVNPAVADRRRLGVAVRSLRLGGKPVPGSAFGRGWHLPESEWRWMDGDARLTLRPLAQAATLEIRGAPGAVPGYWVPPS